MKEITPDKPHPDSDSSQKTAHSLFRLHNAVMEAKSACFYWLFIAACSFIISNLSYQTPAKKANFQKYEDYSFEGLLTKAQEECSYMSLVNDTSFRNRTLQMVKEKIARKTVEEFYRRKEIEKKKAKEYYERVEEQSRRRVLAENGPRWDLNFIPPRPPLPPPVPPLFPHGHLHKRSVGSFSRRRKGSSPFDEVSFTDHNNCSSRCLFARMEMVDCYGFPEESLITKLIEDKVTNKRVRLLKMKRVASCFRKMDEVAFDDSCVFSTKLFECLDLGEQSEWSGLK